MIENYFIYNGIKYYSGTIIKIKRFGNAKEAVFLGYNKNINQYMVRFDTNNTVFYRSDAFNKDIVEITNRSNKSFIDWAQREDERLHPKLTASREVSINGMMLAWIWYVLIMLVAVIFNDRIGIWTFASIVFFSYRNKKLKERGFK